MPAHDLAALRLPPRYLAMVRQILAQQLPGCEVRAYGSRVTGSSHDASDLDLAVLPPADGSAIPSLAAAKEAFVDSDLPIIVQLIDWTRVPESFRREIDAAYVVVQPGRA